MTMNCVSLKFRPKAVEPPSCDNQLLNRSSFDQNQLNCSSVTPSPPTGWRYPGWQMMFSFRTAPIPEALSNQCLMVMQHSSPTQIDTAGGIIP